MKNRKNKKVKAMKTFAVRLPSNDGRKLKTYSRKNKMTVSQVIRDLVKLFLASLGV